MTMAMSQPVYCTHILPVTAANMPLSLGSCTSPHTPCAAEDVIADTLLVTNAHNRSPDAHLKGCNTDL